jgi:hypothetical protein
VLDQQDGVAGLQFGQQRQHALGLFGAHAGQRLVQQQHLRRGGQAHGDLQLPLLAVAQQAGLALQHIGQAGAARPPARGHAGRAALGVLPPGARASACGPARPGGSSPAP